MKILSASYFRVVRNLSVIMITLALPVILWRPNSGNAKQQGLPVARDILLAANSACLALKNASYDLEADRLNNSQTVGNTRSHIIQAWDTTSTKRQLKYSATGTRNIPGQLSGPFAMSYDGLTIRLVDQETQSVFVYKPPVERSETSNSNSPFLFSVPPFKKIVDSGDRLEYEGTGEIDGIHCYIVAVTRTYTAGDFTVPSTSRWYFGANDYLPRRYESSSQRSTVHNLKINSVISETELIAQTPAGFTERVAAEKPADTAGLLAINSMAPDWKLLDEDGRKQSLGDYRGKIVLMSFWGTWCLPCLSAMPHLQSLSQAYRDKGVVVVGLAVPDRDNSVMDYMKQHQLTYGLLPKANEVAKLYKVSNFPTIYVIAADGKILLVEAGGHDNMESEVRAVIETALAGAKP